MITPFKFIRVDDHKTTTASGASWDLLIEQEVPVGDVGSILIDFRSTAVATYTAPSTTYLGVEVRFVWDGEVLSDSGYFELDPAFGPPNIDTLSQALDLRALIEDVAPGPHTLRVEWQTLAADEQADIYPFTANLTIESR